MSSTPPSPPQICLIADMEQRCPSEMQHDIHAHESSTGNGNGIGKETLNTKQSKEIAKYIRLCMDVGAA